MNSSQWFLATILGVLVLAQTVESATCTSQPCQHGGTCVEGTNSYTCICPNNYYGVNCQASPCLPTPCQNGGLCTVLANCTAGSACSYGYNCTCPWPTVTGAHCENAPAHQQFCDGSYGLGINTCTSTTLQFDETNGGHGWATTPFTIFMTVAPTVATQQSTMLFAAQTTHGFQTVMGFIGSNFTASLASTFGDPVGVGLCMSRIGGEYQRNYGQYAFYVITTNLTGDITLYVNGQMVASCLNPGILPVTTVTRYKIAGGDAANTPFHSNFYGYLTRVGVMNRYVSAFDVAQTYFSRDWNFFGAAESRLLPDPSNGLQNALPFLQLGGSDGALFDPVTYPGQPYCVPGNQNYPGVVYAVCNGFTCVNCTQSHTTQCNIATYGGSNCTCSVGWMGDRCETQVGYCDSSPCVNGVCINNATGWTCNCNPGWTGLQCDVQLFACASAPCQNGATCTDSNDHLSHTCSCADGYTGRLCQSLLDTCASNPCRNGGTCVSTFASFRCTCTSAYTGVICADSNPCSSSPCRNGGTCVSSFGCTNLISPQNGPYAGSSQCVFPAMSGLVIAGGSTDVNLDTVYFLDMTTAVFRHLGSLSVARHFSAGGLSGISNDHTHIMIVAGGFGDSGAYANVDVYNFDTQLWSVQPLSSGGGVYTSCAIFQDDFYVIANDPSSMLDVLDGATGNFIRSVSIQAGAGNQAKVGTPLGDCFYIYQSSAEAPLLIYNSTSDAVTTIPAGSLPLDSVFTAPITVANRVLFFASQTSGAAVSGQTLIYTPSTGQLTNVSQVASSRTGLTFVTAAGGTTKGLYVAMYVDGGGTGSTIVAQYDTVSNNFTEIANLTLARLFSTAAFHPGTSTFAVSGGYNQTANNPSYSAQIEFYAQATMQKLPSAAPRCTTQFNCSCASGYLGTACTVCDIGFAGNASACVPCSAGQYSNRTGLSSCASCNNGTFQSATASSTCLNCAPGTYGPTRSGSTCIPCDAGSYSFANGSASCLGCLAGTYQSAVRSTTCNNCTAGSYSSLPSQTACPTCMIGFYQPSQGMTFCLNCTASNTTRPECEAANATVSSSTGMTINSSSTGTHRNDATSRTYPSVYFYFCLFALSILQR